MLTLGANIEHAIVSEQAVGYQGVDMTIVAHVLVPQSRDMDGHHHAELAGGSVQAAAQEFQQALVGDAAKLLEKLPVIAQVDPQHDRETENVLAMRHRISNRAGDEFSEELDFLLVAGRAEPPSLARERQEVVMLAVVAVHADEALGEVAAVEVLVDHVLDDRLKEAVFLLVLLGIGLQEFLEMRLETLPQG